VYSDMIQTRAFSLDLLRELLLANPNLNHLVYKVTKYINIEHSRLLVLVDLVQKTVGWMFGFPPHGSPLLSFKMLICASIVYTIR